jgi:hypothetical protein
MKRDKPDALIESVRVLDDIFIRLVEANPAFVATLRSHDCTTIRFCDVAQFSLDDAVEAMWAALERGELRLVVDGDRLQVEPFAGPLDERLRIARQHWSLVAARQRVLCGVYETQAEQRSPPDAPSMRSPRRRPRHHPRPTRPAAKGSAAR